MKLTYIYRIYINTLHSDKLYDECASKILHFIFNLNSPFIVCRVYFIFNRHKVHYTSHTLFIQLSLPSNAIIFFSSFFNIFFNEISMQHTQLTHCTLLYITILYIVCVMKLPLTSCSAFASSFITFIIEIILN